MSMVEKIKDLQTQYDKLRKEKSRQGAGSG